MKIVFGVFKDNKSATRLTAVDVVLFSLFITLDVFSSEQRIWTQKSRVLLLTLKIFV